jgi:hypothetical protein
LPTLIYDHVRQVVPARCISMKRRSPAELVFYSSTQFDPVVVRAFVAVVQDRKSTILVPDDGTSTHGLTLRAKGILTADDTVDEER